MNNNNNFDNFVCYKCGMKGHSSNWPGCPVNSMQAQITKQNTFFGNVNAGYHKYGKK